MSQPSIKSNWIFNTINKLICFMAPLLVTPYVSRIFGAEGIGINSYTTANVTYFTLFCMLGLADYGRREVAINRDKKETSSIIFWELVILHSVISLIVLIPYIALIIASSKYRIYYLVNLITIVASIIDYNWFFEAYERFKFLSVRNCLIKIVSVALTFLLIHKPADLPIYIAINSASILVANSAVLFGLKKNVVKVEVKRLNWKRHFKEILIYFIPAIAASVYSVLDKSVINWITNSEAENGYYEQAYKMVSVVNVVVQSLAAVTAPRMSNIFAAGNDDELKRRLNQSIQVMIFTTIPCICGITAVTPTLIPVFLGPGFEPSIPIMYVFMPMVLALGFSVYLDGLYIVPSGQRAKSATIVCIGAALNFVLNIILVKSLQSFGAAIATLITEVVIATLMFVISKHMIDVKHMLLLILKYSLIGIVMMAAVRFISFFFVTGVFSLIVQCLLGAGIYLIILTIMKDEYMLLIISRFLGKNKRG